jgi:hypothetical protein
VCYYKAAADDDSTKHISFVVISESNTHDTVAVHLFQRLLLKFLAEKVSTPKHIVYFSDGCAAQYKNRKNFINLCYHEEDFGVTAEWHFFATSHGKGPCDGVGGTVKRLAARASLQRPYDKQILTPRDLFDFACSEIKTVNFIYATTQEHDNEADVLQQRFESARTIGGTQRLHSFRPLSKETLEVREYSASSKMRIEHVSLNEDISVTCPAIRGYVTADYDGHWWLACVLQTLTDSGIITIDINNYSCKTIIFSCIF